MQASLQRSLGPLLAEDLLGEVTQQADPTGKQELTGSKTTGAYGNDRMLIPTRTSKISV